MAAESGSASFAPDGANMPAQAIPFPDSSEESRSFAAERSFPPASVSPPEMTKIFGTSRSSPLRKESSSAGTMPGSAVTNQTMRLQHSGRARAAAISEERCSAEPSVFGKSGMSRKERCSKGSAGDVTEMSLTSLSGLRAHSSPKPPASCLASSGERTSPAPNILTVEAEFSFPCERANGTPHGASAGHGAMSRPASIPRKLRLPA